MNISTLNQEFSILPDLSAIDGFSMSTGIRFLPFRRPAEILTGNYLPYRLEGNWIPKFYCTPVSSQESLGPRETGYLQHRISPGAVIWSVTAWVTTNPVLSSALLQVQIREACGGRSLSQIFEFGSGYRPNAPYSVPLLDPPFIISTQGLVDVQVTNINTAAITYQVILNTLEPVEFEPVIGRP